MNEQEFTMESLKNTELNGYLVFTDATETCEDNGVCIVLTSETKPGIDVALMNAGFSFTDRIDYSRDVFWMERGVKENLRYHPIKNKDFPSAKTAIVQGLKTRIDFFCREKGDAAYDVVHELLKFGYKILAFPPQNHVIEKLFLIELDKYQKPVIRVVDSVR